MKKHILITLCGISPAVITETIFMLTQRKDPPDKVVVITTATGACALKHELIDSGIWASLIEKLKCDIAFSLNHNHLHLLPDEEGDAADITNTGSINQAADFILDVLRQYVSNPDARITFSIAGGRKSMSALGALCMSLLGRSEDRLCHILVNPPFDDPMLKPKFYFPIPGQKHITREDHKIGSETAELLLAELPFVRCRYLIESELKRLPGDYSRMVALANRNIEQIEQPSELQLEPSELLVRIGSREFNLQFQMFLLYWMLAERRSHNLDCLYNGKDLSEEFIDFVQKAKNRLPQKFFYQCSEDKIKETTLHKRVSDLATTLKKQGISGDFLPTRKKGVYGLGVIPEKIHIRISTGCPKS